MSSETVEEEKHDCEKEKCDGKLLNGLTLSCNICGKSCFLTCLTSRDDVFELLQAIDLIKYDTVKKKTKANLNDATVKRLQNIIGRNSLFEFTCLNCRKIGTTIEIIKRLEQNFERVQGININLQEKLDNEYEKTKQLNKTISENKQLIEELTEEANKQNGNVVLNDDMYTQMINNMQIRIENEMDEMKNKLNELMINECKNVKESWLQQKINNEESQKTKKSVTINTPTPNKKQSNEREHTTNTKTIQSSITNYLQPPKKRQDTSEINNELRPPQMKNKTQNDNDIAYAMYVAKFEYGTKKEAIVQHILKKTRINKESFDVEEVETKSSEPNYVAFKIKTLKKEIYDEIMEIWKNTDFQAREYKTKQNMEMNLRNENDKYETNPFRQKQYAQHENERTPWKATYSTRNTIERGRKTPRYTNNRNERETPQYRNDKNRREIQRYERETPKYRMKKETQNYRNDRYETRMPRYRDETPKYRYRETTGNRNEKYETPQRRQNEYTNTYTRQTNQMNNNNDTYIHQQIPYQQLITQGQYVQQPLQYQQGTAQGHFLVQNQNPQVYLAQQ